MFDNIGEKIKTLAMVMAVIGISVSVVAGLILMAGDAVGVGLLVMAGGSLASWIASLGVYGFGQLIENSDILVENTQELLERTQPQAPAAPPNNAVVPIVGEYSKQCPRCGTWQGKSNRACVQCGAFFVEE